jgi:hypothetical protein
MMNCTQLHGEVSRRYELHAAARRGQQEVKDVFTEVILFRGGLCHVANFANGPR